MSEKRVLLIDNYDSFTFNIYQLISQNDIDVDVFRNDKVKLDYLKSIPYTHIVISPGPKTPAESCISLDVIDYYKDKLPVLGICLGMQALAYLYGGKIVKHPPLHGKKDTIRHSSSGVHHNVPSPFKAARYNSLIVKDITESLQMTAWNNDRVIMGLRHRKYPLLEGVQYHPESFMTQHGDLLIDNFLGMKYE